MVSVAGQIGLLLVLLHPATNNAQEAPISYPPVSFRNEVQPILSRAGCNQGACHGNLNGKGGFKLSLRGEDPIFDRNALLKEGWGRRTNSQNPANSLLLRKAIGSLPHEGGPRFQPESSEYQTLVRWIGQGCPDDPSNLPTIRELEVSPREQVLLEPANHLQLKVTGHFSDGSKRDLASLAVFETNMPGIVQVSPRGDVRKIQAGEVVVNVRYQAQQVPVTVAFLADRKDFVWPDISITHPIDQQIFPQLRSLRLTPAKLTDDSMFLRRAYLDTLGILPSANEARTFLASSNPNKRADLIQSLLRRPEFADYWAQKWADLLRNEEKALDRKGVRVFHQWIRDSIHQGKPMDQFARELISARGSTYQNPPTNLYRSLREPYARAESVAQVFLGIRIQCAKCHNHPFDRWTQNDYHQFAAFFSRIDYRILENNRRDRLDSHEFDGEQVVFETRQGDIKHPRTGLPLVPKFLDAPQGIPDPNADRLDLLAQWVTRKENSYFAKNQANRIWYHLLGKGLVEPNDDFRASNPPVNSPLLDLLAKEFVEHDFSLRHLIAFIMTSQTYQLSSQPGITNTEDETHFSKAMIQPLEAEQLLDAVAQVTGSRPKFAGYPNGTRAGQLAALPQNRRNAKSDQSERFLKIFGKPERLMTCECERSEDAGLLQAFQLLTGELMQTMLEDPKNRISKLMDAEKTDREMLDEFYLIALSRYPRPDERQRILDFIAKKPDRRKCMEDIVWSLVNSKEFLLRR